jgi:hypothetical protein
MTNTQFDPARHLTLVSGKEYLEVKWRLVWLRSEHPNAKIITELISHHDNEAVFKAEVIIPDGGSAMGWGSEDARGFGDYLEKAECVPLTVPILTRQGWKYYHQLRDGDWVLGYDVTTQRLTWTTITTVSTFASTPVVQMGNSRFSAVCTPDHKWVINGELVTWDKHSGSGAERITLAAPLDQRGGQPDMAARLGWLMTDAQVSYRGGLPSRAEVQQSKPENFPELERLFGDHYHERDVPDRHWPTGRVSTVLPQRTWSVPAAQVRSILGKYGIASREGLPLAVLGMTRDEAQAFLDAAMAADGFGGGDAFGKTSLPVMEAVQLAAFLVGRTSGVIKERNGNSMTTKPCYTVGIHKAGHKYTSEFRTKPLPPQPVWCPTTGTGTWVANFNGFIGITGNTKAIGRALAALGFGTQFCTDFDFGAAQGRVVDSPVQFRAANVTEGQFDRSQGGQVGADLAATERQRGLIQALARDLKLNSKALDDLAREQTGGSIEGLSRKSASTVIELLKERKELRAKQP